MQSRAAAAHGFTTANLDFIDLARFIGCTCRKLSATASSESNERPSSECCLSESGPEEMSLGAPGPRTEPLPRRKCLRPPFLLPLALPLEEEERSDKRLSLRCTEGGKAGIGGTLPSPFSLPPELKPNTNRDDRAVLGVLADDEAIEERAERAVEGVIIPRKKEGTSEMRGGSRRESRGGLAATRGVVLFVVVVGFSSVVLSLLSAESVLFVDSARDCKLSRPLVLPVLSLMFVELRTAPPEPEPEPVSTSSFFPF
jgi:hypothetical protein